MISICRPFFMPDEPCVPRYFWKPYMSEANAPQHTPLYEQHLQAGGKMVNFAGWEMPINYGSQVQEHHQVRNDAGMFDVSHMVVVDFEGKGVKAFLQHLLANDVAKLKNSGKALYSCMLNEDAGVIDDLIVYYLADDFYRMVINAATRENDLAWINKQIEGFDVTLNERDDLSMIAVQGPNAREKALSTFDTETAEKASALKPFFGAQLGGLDPVANTIPQRCGVGAPRTYGVELKIRN